MYKGFIKRGLDIAVSLLLMPVVGVLTLVVAPAIHLEDRGPVFFRQTRRGLRGSTFRIFKFRTMRVNAEDIRTKDGSTYSGKEDPRVTKIGYVLRQTSLDEVPQIFNILLGDMSFVGPRPTLATEDYSKYSDTKKKRLEVLPGLTGYSQAYYRNSIGSAEKFKQDAYYAEHISFLLDVKIIWRTIQSVLLRKDVNSDGTAIK